MAVLAVLVATLLWFVAKDEGVRSVGAPSAPPPSASSPQPYIPTFVGNIPKFAGAEVPVAPGRHEIQVEGIPISFDIPAGGWQQAGPLYLSKSPDDSGHAAVLLYWTVVDQGTYARPCGQWWGAPPGSAFAYARSASHYHGVETPLPASREGIGGVEGGSTMFRVLEDRGACQPGFLYRWRTSGADTSWTGIKVGDLVHIWVVDVGGTRLVIESDTRVGTPSWLTAELRQIVESIRFRTTTD